MTTWHVEDGKVIEGGLAPFYSLDDLSPGMPVQIVLYPGTTKRARLRRAVVERAHYAYYMGTGSIDRTDCWSTDDGPVTDRCELSSYHSSHGRRSCVHVKYRNGVRAVIHICHIRPLNSAVIELGKLAEETE